MSGVEFRGVTSNQQAQGTGRQASSSPAEREYANAVKELARLQSKLASSATGGEVSEEQAKADQEAVTLAAARVAVAAAAVAQEQQKATEERSPQPQSAAPAPEVSTAELVAEEQRAARLSRVDRTV